LSAASRQHRDKPVANTSLAEWDGKLWALWEAHRPYVLDPDTLETHGEETLGARGIMHTRPSCA
jgi:all-trans-8'-apo-beta-carotenal 15,15'-oxygenase